MSSNTEQSKTPIKPFPTRDLHPTGDLDELRDQWYLETGKALSSNALEVLIGLHRYGPLYDGDVPSKSGRDELLDLGLCDKIIVSGNAVPEACPKYVKKPTNTIEDQDKNGYCWGYQAATYRGAYVFKALLEAGHFKDWARF